MQAVVKPMRRTLFHRECTDSVASDHGALADHVRACQRARGRLFTLRAMLESVHALVSPRIFTSLVVVLACGASIALLI